MTNLSDEVTDKTEAADMVERVAEAIVKRRYEIMMAKGGPVLVEPLELARAAIEAMLEPTEEMIDDGQASLDCTPINRCVEQATKVFTSMIQAALRPTSTRT